MKPIRLFFKLVAMLAALWACPSFADVFPSKPITIVVAYPAGGETDIIARALAEKLQARLGKPVLVDNRVGASGIVGSGYVARARADGYTLLLAPNTLSIAQMVLKTPPAVGYDVIRDFTPIVEVGTAQLFLVANATAGIKSMEEAINASKTRDVHYGSPGTGSPMHILGEMVNGATGARLRHVPYRGVAPAIADLLGGQIELTFVTLGVAAPYFSSGKLVPLGIADEQRSPLAPSVPTFQELGFKGIELFGGWYGLFGPRDIPVEVVQKLNAEINQILKLPEISARMATLGSVPVGGPPEALQKSNLSYFERYGAIIKRLGVQAD